MLHSVEAPDQQNLQHYQDQQWVRGPKPLQHYSSLLRLEEYCSYHEGKGLQTIHDQALWNYLEELVKQNFLKGYLKLYPDI